MRIPLELEQGIENEIKNIKITELKNEAEKLSNRYLNEERTGKTLLSKEIEALAYSIMRMPATYGAISTVLKNTLNIIKKNKFKTLLDIGSGTGATIWAVSNLLDLDKIICLEREEAMRKIGQSLLKYNEKQTDIEWINKDITKDELSAADIIIMSYVINELSEENRKFLIQKLLKSVAKLILIIEPGTPEGFKNVKQIQEIALNKGKYVIAPCTSQEICKLPDNDWCHSVVRMERTKIHKLLKNAELSYEDEKFSYIVISNEKYNLPEARILRHPIIEKGKIILKLCKKGNIEEKIVTKKDKDEFKKAKKKNCGDEF